MDVGRWVWMKVGTYTFPLLSHSLSIISTNELWCLLSVLPDCSPTTVSLLTIAPCIAPPADG